MRGGVIFGGTGNTAEKNRVTGASRHAFETTGSVPSSGNTFDRCKAKKSGGFGLNDTAGQGANTYATTNRFGTEQIGP